MIQDYQYWALVEETDRLKREVSDLKSKVAAIERENVSQLRYDIERLQNQVSGLLDREVPYA